MEKVKKGYTSIASDDCFEFVQSVDFLKNRFAESRVKLIANEVDLVGYSLFRSAWYLPSTRKEQYYIDSLCNLYLKNCMQKEELIDSPSEIFSRIYNHLKPNEQDYAKIEEKKRNQMIREQCDTCIWKDRCQQKYKRPNCSAFEPC